MGGVCVVAEAGTPDAGEDLAKKEAGPDQKTDVPVADLPGPADKGPPVDKSNEAAADQAIADKALPDKALPDKALPDKALPDSTVPDLSPDYGPLKCGDNHLHPAEPCDGTLFPGKSNKCANLVTTGLTYTGGNVTCNNCKLDTSDCRWVVIGSSSKDEQAHGIAVDTSGNPVFTASTGDSGTIGGTKYTLNLTGDHLLLVKLTPQGDVKKITTVYGNGKHVSPTGLDTDASDNVYITGTFGDQLTFGSDTLSAISGNGIFVAGADDKGKFLWGALGATGHKNNTATDVMVGPAAKKSLYITGTYNGAGVFGTQTAANRTFDTCYLGILSVGGGFAKVSHNLGGSHCWVTTGVAVGNSGVYYLGDSNGSVKYGLKSAQGAGNSHLAKWKFPGSINGLMVVLSQGKGRAITADAKDNLYIAGDFTDKVKVGYSTGKYYFPTLTGKSDVIVAKLNYSAKHQWSITAGGNGDDSPRDLALDSSGRVYVAGVFTSVSAKFGSHIATTKSTQLAFVARISKGVFDWVAQTNGSGTVDAARLAVDSSGNVYVSGWFTGTSTFGDGKAITAKGKDLFVWKLKSTGP